MDKWIIGLTYASALARLPAAQGIVAMQSINSTILQTLFSFVFMGTAFASVILGGVSFFRLGTPGALYILIGSLLYFVGTFLATIVFFAMRLMVL